MSDVSLDNFLPDVLPWVRDCPEVMARIAILNACIEFCNQSHWWVDSQQVQSLIAGQNTYSLDAPTDAEIVTPADVRAGGRLLEGKSPDELDLMFGNDWRTQLGAPRYYTRMQPAEIILVPGPADTQASGLKMTLVLAPAKDAQFVDEELWRNWSEDIGYGARARLHELPNQPFSDAAAAGMYWSRFRAGINTARAERYRGMTRGPVSVRFPRVI